MEKEDVTHIYNGILLSHCSIKRNKIGSFVEMWMDLETVIQSEVRDFPGGPVVKTLRFY